MATMGMRIKQLRNIRKLTQKDLAALTGLAQNTISDLERGDSKTMDARTLQALCIALVTTPAHLLDGASTDDEAQVILQEAELVAIFRELPEHSKIALMGSARLLKEAMPPR